MEQLTYIRHRVYDPVLRSIHAWNGLAILLLLLSGQLTPHLDYSEGRVLLWHLHIWLGYALMLGWCARLAWGLVGPDHARWSSMWHLHAWKQAWRNKRGFTVPRTFGHHPLASAVYLLFYLLLAVMLASGLLLAAGAQNTGPFYVWFGHDAELKSAAHIPHIYGQYFLWLFLFIHLAALIMHERRHGMPVAQAMISGYQYLECKP